MSVSLYIKSIRHLIIYVLLLLTLPLMAFRASARPINGEQYPPQTLGARRAYGQLPLAFVPNTGQTHSSVQYQAQMGSGGIFFATTGLTLSLPSQTSISEKRMDPFQQVEKRSAPVATPPQVVHMTFEGSNPNLDIQGTDRLPGVVNYYLGNDPTRWRTQVATYASLVYRELYPGIDLHYEGHTGSLKGTYIVAPGRDPALIRWRYEGTANVQVNPTTGDLEVTIEGTRRLLERAPVAWQERVGQRLPVEARYQVNQYDQVGFTLGRYDPRLPLIIDPVIAYSFVVNGNDGDIANDVAVDAGGNAFMTGLTGSVDLPTSGWAAQPNHSPDRYADAFVLKLDARGTIVYLTYLGGNSSDNGNAIATDGAGNAYLTGWTKASNFPIFNAFQSVIGGTSYSDAFVTKLSPHGTFVYSTYLGGSHNDTGNDITVDREGAAYITGETYSHNFPTRSPLQSSNRGEANAFVTKLNAAGTDLIYSTYLGSPEFTHGNGIAVDSANNAYVVGTDINPIHVMRNANALVFKLNSAGNVILYSIYLGGSDNDFGSDIAVDSAGNAHVIGWTESTDFPTRNPVQASAGGSYDIFVTKLNAAGNDLLYSTYFGGSGSDYGTGIVIDRNNRAHITGMIRSPNLHFPAWFPYVGGTDAFVAKLGTSGARIYWSYLGGTGNDLGGAIGVDDCENPYIVGSTYSSDYPANRLFSQPGGAGDAFITKLGLAPVTLYVFRDGILRAQCIGATAMTYDATYQLGPLRMPYLNTAAADWNGDWVETFGTYHEGVWQITDDRRSDTTQTFQFGGPGWLPVVGDWDGDGKATLGVYKDGEWRLTKDNTASSVTIYQMGSPGWLPVVGDWDGDGKATLGVYKDGEWRLTKDNTAGSVTIYQLGGAGWLPVVGDWDNDRKQTIGVFKDGAWQLSKDNTSTNLIHVTFGEAGWTPLIGHVRLSAETSLSTQPTTPNQAPTQMAPTFQPPK